MSPAERIVSGLLGPGLPAADADITVLVLTHAKGHDERVARCRHPGVDGQGRRWVVTCGRTEKSEFQDDVETHPCNWQERSILIVGLA